MAAFTFTTTDTMITVTTTTTCCYTEVQSLVLNGRLGEAIRTTQLFYPDLLRDNLELLFVLRCRQFVEIVNGRYGDGHCQFLVGTYVALSKYFELLFYGL